MPKDKQYFLWKIRDLIGKSISHKGFGEELIAYFLERVSRMDSAIGSFVALNDKILDAEIKPQKSADVNSGKLAGIPIAVKDIFDTSDIPTSYGSSIYRSHLPARDSRIVARIKSNGGKILGKTRTHEFALSILTPGCRNPWDLNRIAGGSSGGSAAAVAAGLAPAATGSDTGGSIRIPASMCGVVGFKPTYGSLSMQGIFPEAPSLDHAGVFCRYAEDLPILLESMGMKLPQSEKRDHVWKVALLDDLFLESDSAVSRTIEEQIVEANSKGVCSVEHLALGNLDRFRQATDTIDAAESSFIHKERLSKHRDAYLPISVDQIETGLRITAEQYLSARRTQKIWRNELSRIFRKTEFLLMPTQPETAPEIDRASKMGNQELNRYLNFTKLFNLSGNPAISLPAGFVNGLPIGLQVVGDYRKDLDVISFSESFQAMTTWHRAIPHPLE